MSYAFVFLYCTKNYMNSYYSQPMPTYATMDILVHIIEQVGLIILFSVGNYYIPVGPAFIPFNLMLLAMHDQCWRGCQVYIYSTLYIQYIHTVCMHNRPILHITTACCRYRTTLATQTVSLCCLHRASWWLTTKRCCPVCLFRKVTVQNGNIVCPLPNHSQRWKINNDCYSQITLPQKNDRHKTAAPSHWIWK